MLDGKAPIYHAEGGAAPVGDDDEKESFGHKVYKHLMNGVSNMLPFTIAGGIFIAIAFLIDTLAGAPQDSSFGTYTAAVWSAVIWQPQVRPLQRLAAMCHPVSWVRCWLVSLAVS